jgi:hypothetical protein
MLPSKENNIKYLISNIVSKLVDNYANKCQNRLFLNKVYSSVCFSIDPKQDFGDFYTRDDIATLITNKFACLEGKYEPCEAFVDATIIKATAPYRFVYV